MRYTVRPISDRTWLRPNSARVASRFDSTWGATSELLGREIDLLGGRDVVIEVDVPENHIRNDGQLRANARASSPAVVVAFETKKHGSLLYRCDRFYAQWSGQGESWQQNARAIALTLEALRAVDRYGATETGQQYTGFKALPAGSSAAPSHMTTDEAWSVLGSYAEGSVEATRLAVASGLMSLGRVVRTARSATHPDRHNGDQSLWNLVEQAAKVLGIA